MSTPENSDCHTTTLHLKYWILILLLVLIAVMSDRWTGAENFTEYLTNAATMVSLVLALVAIFYSFIANDGLSKSLGNIGVVSEEVRKSKDAIGDFLKETRQATSKGEENTIALEAISNTLKTNLSELQQALDTVATQTQELPGRFDKLETTFTEAAKGLGAKPMIAENVMTPSKQWSEADIDLFCARLPLAGNLLMYACVLANQTGKKLSLAELDTAVGATFESFNAGVISGIYGSQMINRKYLGPRTYEITSIVPELSKVAKTYLVDYITNTYSEEPEDRALWLKRLDSVETFFGVKP